MILAALFISKQGWPSEVSLVQPVLNTPLSFIELAQTLAPSGRELTA